MDSKPTLATSKKQAYKFITRNLHISDENRKVFQKACIKRVYLKKIIDKRRRGSDPDEKVYRPFKKNKLFKTLKTVQIPCIHKSYAHESLKSSKLLKSFCVNACSDNPSLQKVALYIKRFPVRIQSLKLEIVRDRSVPHQHFCKLARSIRILKNLESFHRAFVLESRRPHLERELKAYSESAGKLKKLKNLIFKLSDGEQKEFYRTMSGQNRMYPGITVLEINLQGDSFPNYERFEPLTRSEDSFDADKPSELENMNPLQHKLYSMILKNVIKDGDDRVENPEDDDSGDDEEDNDEDDGWEEEDEDYGDDQEEEEEEIRYERDDNNALDNLDANEKRLLAEQLPNLLGGNFNEWWMREALRSFYRFELFPDLKRVSIRQDDQHIPYDSFVIDAFAALKKLEHLEITIHTRPQGSYNLFKGFLKLPLIKKFSLGLPFIKNNDWTLLQQFVKNQTNLEAFSLKIWNQAHKKERYLQQNVYFEELIKCLEGKPLLKSLELRSEYWSLEALSKGFSHLTMVNQLKRLVLEGSDDNMMSDSKPLKRVEGLCNFIKSQKDSLELLGAFLPFANEDNIVNHIAEAISKLSHLKELQLSINPRSYQPKTFGQFSESIFERQKEPKMTSKVSEPWNPCVGESFKKLENLELLWFKFDTLGNCPPTWFVDIMAALPSLDRLRDIRIISDSGRKLFSEEEKIINAVEQLNNVRNIDFMCYSYPDEGQLKKVFNKVNERQSMRCDLMF